MGLWWMNEMGWEMKIVERDETGENNRREGGEMVGMKTWGREEVEWRNKRVNRGDYSRYVKEVRPSNTPSSRDSMEFEFKDVLKKWLMEWKRMKGREDERGRTRNGGHWKDQMGGRQGCWSRESENKDEERNGWNEVNLKRRKFGKTRKDTRWKRGELIVVESVRKQSESEDGGMRELRDIRGW